MSASQSRYNRCVMQERVSLSRRRNRHQDNVARSDMRWLLVWLAVFLATTLTFLAAHQVYRLTGPHPQVTALVRKLKHHARWLIPGLKGRSSSLLHAPVTPSPPPHYADSSRMGQDAQRANA